MNTYNRRQETVNGLVHGFGVLFGISCLPVVTSMAINHGNTPGIVGSIVYGFSFILLFTASTLFHLVQEPMVRRIFKILDHISIYFLISGTYTPFLLIYMHNSFGMSLLWILWSLTLVGIFFKIRYTGRFEILSTIIYVMMGLIVLVGGRQFFDSLPSNVVLLICIGAGLYLTGVFFYLWDKYLYTHAVWHIFVLVAAVCHYVAVMMAM